MSELIERELLEWRHTSREQWCDPQEPGKSQPSIPTHCGGGLNTTIMEDLISIINIWGEMCTYYPVPRYSIKGVERVASAEKIMIGSPVLYVHGPVFEWCARLWPWWDVNSATRTLNNNCTREESGPRRHLSRQRTPEASAWYHIHWGTLTKWEWFRPLVHRLFA